MPESTEIEQLLNNLVILAHQLRTIEILEAYTKLGNQYTYTKKILNQAHCRSICVPEQLAIECMQERSEKPDYGGGLVPAQPGLLAIPILPRCQLIILNSVAESERLFSHKTHGTKQQRQLRGWVFTCAPPWHAMQAPVEQ